MADAIFDLLVIGAGPGGYVAAIRAAQLGMHVGCIERESLGGTCLNIGCIPSKALLESSELLHQAQTTFQRHGIQTGGVELDLGGMMKRKEGIVKKMTAGIRGLFRKNKVTHMEGTARLQGNGTVAVESSRGTETFQARRILIATGSSPIELPGLAFDGEHILSSTEALSLSTVPEKMIVIGAGAIGLELGSVWSRLGSEVLVVEFLDRITPPMDREMSDLLQKSLEKQGLGFRLKTRAESAEVKEAKVQVRMAAGEETVEETCDKLLVAVGRRPNTEGLGASEAGLELDDRGRVVIHERFETNLEGVFAIGDVVAGPMLAHKAEEEGVAAVELMAGKAGQVNYDAIPNVVYTDPELASVGLNEEELKEKGVDYKVGKFPFMANGRAHSLDAIEGQVKVISDAKTDRLLGLHILGSRASDLLAEGVLALEFCASSEDIARTMHAHPTLSEAIKEAALAVDNEAIHI
ncbi:MAG: dihydrolipoyl dehydrogenase [bacterium]|nr:dihydrolipoyl dehydrogenase [bacterium]